MGGQILTEFFCDLCEFITDNGQDLEEHINQFHNSNTTNQVPHNDDLSINTNEEDEQDLNDVFVVVCYNCGKCSFFH